MKKLLSIAALATALTSNASWATPISGTSLQTALTGAGAVVDVNTDQYLPDQYWVTGTTTVSVAKILFEFAANAPTNSFGIYDRFNPGTSLQVFNGAASPGSIALFAQTGSSGGTQYCAAPLFSSSSTCATFVTDQFGFYLQTSSGILYSDKLLNAGSFDQMVAFQGGTGKGSIGGSPWLSNEFVLAWEDLIGGGDQDYDDFVVVVESVTGVPEPATLGMLGFGLLAFALVRRRQAIRRVHQ